MQRRAPDLGFRFHRNHISPNGNRLGLDGPSMLEGGVAMAQGMRVRPLAALAALTAFLLASGAGFGIR